MAQDIIVRLRLPVSARQGGRNMNEEIPLVLLDDLALKLAEISPAWSAGRSDLLVSLSRGITAISDQLGLHDLAALADSAGRLAGRDDPAALAARLARLVRMGEAEVQACWIASDGNRSGPAPRG